MNFNIVRDGLRKPIIQKESMRAFSVLELLENRNKTPEKARSNKPGGILDELNDDSFASISDENSDGNETNLREEKCELCGKVSFLFVGYPLIVAIQSIKFKSGQLEVILNHYHEHAVSEYLKSPMTANHSVAEIDAIRNSKLDHNSAFIHQVT